MSEKLQKMYAEIDRRAARLFRLHGARLNCRRGCAGCCVDGLTVFEIEAANIRQNHPDLLKNETPNSESGGCAFLDADGACRIYESRPYVCRTQGLPLRWLEEIDDEIFELRDICPLNEAGGAAVEELPEEICWTIGEFEEKLALLQIESGGDLKRIALRELFTNR
jgi:uncharacterized protein